MCVIPAQLPALKILLTPTSSLLCSAPQEWLKMDYTRQMAEEELDGKDDGEFIVHLPESDRAMSELTFRFHGVPTAAMPRRRRKTVVKGGEKVCNALISLLFSLSFFFLFAQTCHHRNIIRLKDNQFCIEKTNR